MVRCAFRLSQETLAFAFCGSLVFGSFIPLASYAAEHEVQRISEGEFQKTVIERSHERVVVMDFYADWCAACRQMAPDLDAMAATYKGRVSVVQVNGDDAEDLAKRFDVPGFPVLIAFSEGTMIDMLKGAQTRDVLNQWFAVLSGANPPDASPAN